MNWRNLDNGALPGLVGLAQNVGGNIFNVFFLVNLDKVYCQQKVYWGQKTGCQTITKRNHPGRRCRLEN